MSLGATSRFQEQSSNKRSSHQEQIEREERQTQVSAINKLKICRSFELDLVKVEQA